MFILATIVIAAYCMIITSVLIEVQLPPTSLTSSTAFFEVYHDTHREIRIFLKSLLVRYTNNSMTTTQATITLSSFLSETLESYAWQKGVDMSLGIRGEVSFVGNQSTSENVMDGNSYSARVSASFTLAMREVSGDSSIFEEFEEGYEVVAIVNGPRLQLSSYDVRGNLISSSVDAIVVVGGITAENEPNGYYFFETGLPTGTLTIITQDNILIYS